MSNVFDLYEDEAKVEPLPSYTPEPPDEGSRWTDEEGLVYVYNGQGYFEPYLASSTPGKSPVPYVEGKDHGLYKLIAVPTDNIAYQELVDRAVAIDKDLVSLIDDVLKRHGIEFNPQGEPQNLTTYELRQAELVIVAMEKEQPKQSKKQKAETQKNILESRYQDIVSWAEQNGVSGAEVAYAWTNRYGGKLSVGNLESLKAKIEGVSQYRMTREKRAELGYSPEPDESRKMLAAEQLIIEMPSDLAPPIQAPAVIEEAPTLVRRDDGLLINEDGEIVNPEKLAQILQLTVEEAKKFAVTDKESAAWFVGKVVGLQNEMISIAQMAGLMINQLLSYHTGMMWKYGPQLRSFVEPLVESDRDKNGKLRSKNYRFLAGGVYFKKEGGLKLERRNELQEAIDALSDEQLQDWIDAGLVKVVRQIDTKKVTALINSGELDEQPGYLRMPVQEFGQMSIGVKRAWTPRQIKTQLKTLTLGDSRVPEGEEGEEEDEDSGD